MCWEKNLTPKPPNISKRVRDMELPDDMFGAETTAKTTYDAPIIDYSGILTSEKRNEELKKPNKLHIDVKKKDLFR